MPRNIFDLSGRVVRTLTQGAQGPGTYQIEWDGRDDNARYLPAGVYLARLRANQQSVSGKVILTR